MINHTSSEGPSPNIHSGSRGLCKVKCLGEIKDGFSEQPDQCETQVHFSAKPWVLWAPVTQRCCSSLVLEHSLTWTAAPSSIYHSLHRVSWKARENIHWNKDHLKYLAPWVKTEFIHPRGMKCNSITDTQGLRCHKENQKGTDLAEYEFCRGIWVVQHVPSKEHHLKGEDQPPRPVMLPNFSQNSP